MPDPIQVADSLSEAERKALLGSHRLSDYSDERAIYHLCPQETLDSLWDKGLLLGCRYVNAFGRQVRAILQEREQ